MKKYIVFSAHTGEAIRTLQTDFLKLKVSFPSKKFQVDKHDLIISCEEFEVRYISIWKPEVINGLNEKEINGVYDSNLLGINILSEWSIDNPERFIPFENNEFLVWMREGDLMV